MSRRELIWRLRNIKARMMAAGPIPRLGVPFVEVCEFWLSHGFREVVMRSRVRLGLLPHNRMAVSSLPSMDATLAWPAEASFAGTVDGATEADRDRAFASAWARAFGIAQNRPTPEFVPESTTQTDFRNARVRVIAFYLPQFHPIPENDRWWGRGFTEWRNVAKATPQFSGHYQPRLPGELGFYDLRVRDVQRRQVELARAYGVQGFCFHYYWFNGRRLLDRPLDEYVADDSIDFPFCICWANENWTRRWDGLEHEVLIAQVHSEDADLAFIKSVEPLLRDPRYITVNGRPLIVVYRVSLLPNPAGTVARWKAYCRQAGLNEPFLVAAQTFGFTDPRTVGFDAAVEFPPHNVEAPDISRSVRLLNPNFDGRISKYETLATRMRSFNANRPYRVFRCVAPSWDNEARKPGRGYVLLDSTPEAYREWLDWACSVAAADVNPGARIVFINAWNEWAEGAYLEPDARYGYAYLEQTRQVVAGYVESQHTVSVIVPNYNHAPFLERRLRSILGQSRRPDEIIFLDDASTDDSVAMARRILDEADITYSIITNPTNSGSVFRQWVKGLGLAQGDLIWIAESDDDADPDFLRQLLPAFRRKDVLLASGSISYINADGSPNGDLNSYFRGLPGDGWGTSHTRAAHDLFSSDFSIKNVIPNASGAVFRRPTLSLQEIERLQAYRFAGDWYFYALVSRGGSISFSSAARSFFRKRERSASNGAFFTDLHVREHAMILEDLEHLHGLPAATRAAHVKELDRVLSQGPVQSSRLATVTLSAIPASARRAPDAPRRICIASYGFTIGGGEMAPIVLANALRSAGHHVTFLVLNDEQPGAPSLRRRLRNDIPILLWETCHGDFNRVVRDFGFDVINSHNVAIEYAFFRRGVTLSVPYVATLHGGYETVPEIITVPFMTYLDRLVSTWLYTAERNRDVLVNAGLKNRRFVQAFNAVEPPVGRPDVDLRRRLNVPVDAVVLGLASRAIHDKGWDIAIDVAERLRCRLHRDVHLVLIGAGEHLAAMQQRASGLPFVSFWGSTDNAIDLVRQCNVALFPSTYAGESFPLFVLECFAAGVPVIATDVGSIRQMMTTTTGAIAGAIVPASPDRTRIAADMTDALEPLLADSSALDAARGNAAERQRTYSVPRMIDTYLSVFASV